MNENYNQNYSQNSGDQNNSNQNNGQNEYGSQNPWGGSPSSGNGDKDPKKGGRTALKVLVGVLVFGSVAVGGYQGAKIVDDYYNKKTEVAADAEKGGDDTLAEDDSIGNVSDGEVETTANMEMTDTEGAEKISGSVAKIVENVMPAIVSIDCTSYTTKQDIWGRQYKSQSGGSGSGIIIGQNDSEVLIVTNAHVVAGTQPTVRVKFVDDSDLEATIKGADEESDLAVVSVKMSSISDDTKDKIRIATLGSSDDVKVGEMAIAIGNALGYGQSVTVGYISAKDRTIDIEDSSQTMSLLQTDAAINPGNSGGALINSKGEIIGINSAKFSSVDVEGMGYVIPISDGLPIIKSLMNNEEVEHKKAYFGIKGMDIDASVSATYHMPEGIYIREVTEDSPAAQSGFYPGMIITKVNGDSVTTMEELENILSRSKAGDTMEITVQQMERGEYKEATISVTLGEKSDTE